MNREELEKYIADYYSVLPETPWMKYPRDNVFRHSNNRKWFALIMEISKEKIGLCVMYNEVTKQ